MDKKTIYEHKMTPEEISQCKRIESIIQDATGFKGGRAFSIGNPIYKQGTYPDGSDRYIAAGDCYTSLFCITEDNFHFHYYIVEVGDRGNFGFRDFDDEYEKFYKKYHENMIMFDAVLYKIIRNIADEYNIDFKTQFTDHRGILAKVEYHEANNRYSLHLLHGYGSGMAADGMAHELAYSKPVFVKDKCVCGHKFFFNDMNIPDGELYECTCPNCGMLLKRKKV